MVPDGMTILDAAKSADVHLNASCGGKVLCGKCKLIIESGHVESKPEVLLTEKEKKENYVLACMSEVYGDVTVRIPEEALEKKLKVAATTRNWKTVNELYRLVVLRFSKASQFKG